MMAAFGACFDDDGNFNFESYLLYRSKRMREEEDDEADVNDEDDKPKKRQFKSRDYAGYDPNDALNSEWYRRYVSDTFPKELHIYLGHSKTCRRGLSGPHHHHDKIYEC